MHWWHQGLWRRLCGRQDRPKQLWQVKCLSDTNCQGRRAANNCQPGLRCFTAHWYHTIFTLCPCIAAVGLCAHHQARACSCSFLRSLASLSSICPCTCAAGGSHTSHIGWFSTTCEWGQSLVCSPAFAIHRGSSVQEWPVPVHHTQRGSVLRHMH
jgi:hypothetical protein